MSRAEPIRLVPTEDRGRVRTIAHLEPVDARSYATVVARVLPRIERALSRGVYANRARVGGGRFTLAPWRPARARFLRAAGTMGAAPGVIAADVRDCYGSIAVGAVERALLGYGCAAQDVEAVARVLHAFQERGVRGLPVGPDPSAVLANAVLATADEAVRRAGALHLRWVDDFLVFVRRRADLRGTLEVLRAAVSEAGLELAEPKTRVACEPSESAELLASVRGSGPTYNRRG